MLSSYTLLVVEDDPVILHLLQTLFLSHGAKVLTAADGREALRQIDEGKPDLIVLDVVIPYVDGLTVLETLRKSAVATPVILLTERNTIDEKVKGLESGADDYITKPFNSRELLARVSCQLRRIDQIGLPAGEKDGLHIGILTILPRAREVHLGDAGSVALTKTEFELLWYLAQRHRQVVPQAEMLREVMGYKTDTETKALVMHIANIRRKCEQIRPGAVQLQAVSGVGYKLSVGQ
jgi:DNA-binding response OmpR family regulator